jgi:ornithine--oxo-acid transaminase
MNHLARNSTSLRMILQRAKGSWVWDASGKKYLDAFSSYSSANFGHQHPLLRQELIRQSQKVSVFSRTLTSDILLSLCELVYDYYHKFIIGGQLSVIPMNSGVEAGETAVKFSRKWGYLKKGVPQGQAKVLFAKGNYWGKTISAISTSEYEFQKLFYPKVPGFLTAEYNSVEAISSALASDPNIVAVYLEPVQGEGGINIPDANYFANVRKLCTLHNVLLIADEIQTGMGRVSAGLCLSDYNTQVDMFLLGKSLGGGYLPISLCVARKDVADVVEPGEHSSTFGGYPLGCAMAKASLQLLHETDLLQVSTKRENLFRTELTCLQKKFPEAIEAVRGKGMLFGIQFRKEAIDALDMCHRLAEVGLITREANHNTIRICPALTSSDVELDYLFTNLNKAVSTL